MALTSEQEAWAIGQLASVFDELRDSYTDDVEAFMSFMELAGKAIVASSPNPQNSVEAIAQAIRRNDDNDNGRIMKHLGYRKIDDE